MTNPTPTPLDLDAWSARCDRAEETGDSVTIGWRTARAFLNRAREADGLQRERAVLYDKLNGTPCAEIRWQQERALLIQSGLDMMAKITTLRAAVAKAVEALESIRLKLSYAGQDAVSRAVAQSNLNAAYHETVAILPQLREAIK